MRRTFLKIREYGQIKNYLTYNGIMKSSVTFGRSPRLIDRVRDSKDFEEYKKLRHEYSLKNNGKYRKGGEKMKTRNHYTAVTEKDFTLVKALLESGMSKSKVADISGRSYFTVTYLEKANSFQEYTTMIQAYSEKQKQKYHVNNGTTEKVPEKEKIVYNPNTDILSVLNSINKNLGRMADAWEAHPDKKSLVDRLTGN